MIELNYTYGLRTFFQTGVDQEAAGEALLQAQTKGLLKGFPDVLALLYQMGVSAGPGEGYSLESEVSVMAADYTKSLVGLCYQLAAPDRGWDVVDPFDVRPVNTDSALSLLALLEEDVADKPLSGAPPDDLAFFEVQPPSSAFFFGQFTKWEDAVLSDAAARLEKSHQVATSICDTSASYFEGLSAKSGFDNDFKSALNATYETVSQGVTATSSGLQSLASGDPSFLKDLSGPAGAAAAASVQKALSTSTAARLGLEETLSPFADHDGYAANLAGFSESLTDIERVGAEVLFALNEFDRIASFVKFTSSGSYDDAAAEAIAQNAHELASRTDELGVLVYDPAG